MRYFSFPLSQFPFFIRLSGLADYRTGIHELCFGCAKSYMKYAGRRYCYPVFNRIRTLKTSNQNLSPALAGTSAFDANTVSAVSEDRIVWFLSGQFGMASALRHVPIHSSPF